ncbi:hypothetical protein PLICRDRAFT_350140 [Plicaturopsis crispa FD-325 SS-3]|uniref:Uncharacterized protein n=1 Tax=Plicaturopsis crispa FD-325 SS-3 TaxID=944288 RepID=A0A0C9T6L8_PLICR|nr:hypothetical protein PLICRDRAFT_350140 [Plicaturopsis crispa FD-325 SS-3]
MRRHLRAARCTTRRRGRGDAYGYRLLLVCYFVSPTVSRGVVLGSRRRRLTRLATLGPGLSQDFPMYLSERSTDSDRPDGCDRCRGCASMCTGLRHFDRSIVPRFDGVRFVRDQMI